MPTPPRNGMVVVPQVVTQHHYIDHHNVHNDHFDHHDLQHRHNNQDHHAHDHDHLIFTDESRGNGPVPVQGWLHPPWNKQDNLYLWSVC